MKKIMKKEIDIGDLIYSKLLDELGIVILDNYEYKFLSFTDFIPSEGYENIDELIDYYMCFFSRPKGDDSFIPSYIRLY
jgi:hypothetical protein